MAKRDTIIKALDTYLKVADFTDYTPIGLQVEGAEQVRRITTGVSISVDLLEAAVEAKSQMVLVHHGMFWKKQSPVIRGPQKQRIAFLLDHDITLAAYHLPLDTHRQVGNNAQLVKLLGARIKQPFGYEGGLPLGFTAAFDRARGADRIMNKLEALSPEGVLYCPGSEKPIKRIAVVSGGASHLFEEAIERGDVDLFLTGEPWEPAQALARESGVGFLAMGHYNSEKPGIIALGGWLKKRFKVAVEFVDLPNPA